MKFFSALFALGLFSVFNVPATGAPTAEEVVAKVRAAIGGENALTAVNTLSYEAKLSDADDKQIGMIILRYKTPNKRSEYMLRTLEAPVPAGGEGAEASKTLSVQIEKTLATDGLEAFEKQRNINSGESRLNALSGIGLSVLKDYAVADLGLYGVPKGGAVKFAGEEKKAGKDCYVLEYTFAGGSKFLRYFDKNTFMPVAQQVIGITNPNDNYIADEGEIVEKGIKFPKKNIQFNKDGKKEATVEFTKIVVNGDIPDSVFAFPMP